MSGVSEMIGVSDKSWLIDLLSSVATSRPNLVPEIAANNDQHIYSTHFGLGHQLKLHDSPGVFTVSLAGIRDVLARYKAFYPAGAPLQFQLLERHSLPLLFYSPGWKRAEPSLREEFEEWRDSYGAAYTIDGQGRLYWSYEVVECRCVPTALG